MNSHIKLQNLSHGFNHQGRYVSLFNDINLSFSQGHSYAITGQSGEGKTSLLMLAAGLDTPASGDVLVECNGQTEAISHHKSDLGFIFQQFHLLPELDALSNVALPLLLRGRRDANEKAESMLSRVGLSHRINHAPFQLSGGEQQRVAIARALVFEPKFIFADEPTGNLDAATADEVANVLFESCASCNAALILVTHSQRLARLAQTHFCLSNGQISLMQSDQNLGVA